MIKNIVFDIGKVLVEFDWQSYLDSLGFPEEVREKVAKATVLSPVWREFDRGRQPEEEILAQFIAGATECRQEILAFWEHVGSCIQRYDYTMDWIRELRGKGYRIYFLSNYPCRIYEQSREALAFTELMDGGIFSYEIQIIKPEPEIYEALFETYGLNPAECAFLDDNRENVTAAEGLGMAAVQFQTKAQAVEALKRIGVN